MGVGFLCWSLATGGPVARYPTRTMLEDLMIARTPRDPSHRHMRIRSAVAGALLCIALVPVRSAGAPLDMRLHVDASLRTNAVYHLACLGGSISCSREIFERFWNDRLHESADDRENVAAW